MTWSQYICGMIDFPLDGVDFAARWWCGANSWPRGTPDLLVVATAALQHVFQIYNLGLHNLRSGGDCICPEIKLNGQRTVALDRLTNNDIAAQKWKYGAYTGGVDIVNFPLLGVSSFLLDSGYMQAVGFYRWDGAIMLGPEPSRDILNSFIPSSESGRTVLIVYNHISAGGTMGGKVKVELGWWYMALQTDVGFAEQGTGAQA